MNYLEDYPQEKRFYTGLYSTKAFDFVKKAISHQHCWGVNVVRSSDKETVVCAKNSIYLSISAESVGATPDNLRRALSESLKKEAANPSNSGDEQATAYALYKFLTGDADVDEACAALTKKLKGKASDPASAEIELCLQAEIKKIENEHKSFDGGLGLRHSFPSVNGMFGVHGWRPGPKLPQCPVEFENIDQAELSGYNEIEAEMTAANNALVEAFARYEKSFEEFKEKLRSLKALNTKTKNDRIKALKAEFREAKRASSGKAA